MILSGLVYLSRGTDSKLTMQLQGDRAVLQPKVVGRKLLGTRRETAGMQPARGSVIAPLPQHRPQPHGNTQLELKQLVTSCRHTQGYGRPFLLPDPTTWRGLHGRGKPFFSPALGILDKQACVSYTIAALPVRLSQRGCRDPATTKSFACLSDGHQEATEHPQPAPPLSFQPP